MYIVFVFNAIFNTKFGFLSYIFTLMAFSRLFMPYVPKKNGSSICDNFFFPNSLCEFENDNIFFVEKLNIANNWLIKHTSYYLWCMFISKVNVIILIRENKYFHQSMCSIPYGFATLHFIAMFFPPFILNINWKPIATHYSTREPYNHKIQYICSNMNLVNNLYRLIKYIK